MRNKIQFHANEDSGRVSINTSSVIIITDYIRGTMQVIIYYAPMIYKIYLQIVSDFGTL